MMHFHSGPALPRNWDTLRNSALRVSSQFRKSMIHKRYRLPLCPSSWQGTKQSAHAIPQNLDADANEEKGREPQNDAHPVFSDNRGETIGEAVAKINAQRHEGGTDHRARIARRFGPRC